MAAAPFVVARRERTVVLELRPSRTLRVVSSGETGLQREGFLVPRVRFEPKTERMSRRSHVTDLHQQFKERSGNLGVLRVRPLGLSEMLRGNRTQAALERDPAQAEKRSRVHWLELHELVVDGLGLRIVAGFVQRIGLSAPLVGGCGRWTTVQIRQPRGSHHNHDQRRHYRGSRQAHGPGTADAPTASRTTRRRKNRCRNACPRPGRRRHRATCRPEFLPVSSPYPARPAGGAG